MNAGRVLYNHGSEVVTAGQLVARAEATAIRVSGSRESFLFAGCLAGALEAVVGQLCLDLEAAQSGRMSARAARARIADLTGAIS